MPELHGETEEEDDEAKPHLLSIQVLIQTCCIRPWLAPNVVVAQDKEQSWSDKDFHFVHLQIFKDAYH